VTGNAGDVVSLAWTAAGGGVPIPGPTYPFSVVGKLASQANWLRVEKYLVSPTAGLSFSGNTAVPGTAHQISRRGEGYELGLGGLERSGRYCGVSG